jgi:DNA-binding MarR family transcriptional regulator
MASTHDSDDLGLAGDFGWALRALSSAFQNVARDAVADIPGGARGYLVLIAVAEENTSSQLALANRLAIDKTQMTYVVDRLEAAGLVERAPDPADRRARIVTLTAAGRKRLSRARQDVASAEGRLLDVLEPAQRSAFRQALTRIAEATLAPGPIGCDASG